MNKIRLLEVYEEIEEVSTLIELKRKYKLIDKIN